MSNFYAVAGCKFYVGGIKNDQDDDFIASDFDGENWTQVDGWTQMGAFGDTAAQISFPVINRGRDVKLKGTANAGSMQNQFAQIAEDAGQIKLIAASQPSDRNNYAFRVDFNDAVNGGQPSKRFFIGLVTTAQESGGQANTQRQLDVTIEINSNIVRVPRT